MEFTRGFLCVLDCRISNDRLLEVIVRLTHHRISLVPEQKRGHPLALELTGFTELSEAYITSYTLVSRLLCLAED